MTSFVLSLYTKRLSYQPPSFYPETYGPLTDFSPIWKSLVSTVPFSYSCLWRINKTFIYKLRTTENRTGVNEGRVPVSITHTDHIELGHGWTVYRHQGTLKGPWHVPLRLTLVRPRRRRPKVPRVVPSLLLPPSSSVPRSRLMVNGPGNVCVSEVDLLFAIIRSR